MTAIDFGEYPDIGSVPRHRRLSDHPLISRMRHAVDFEHVAVSGLDLDRFRFGGLQSVDSDFPPAFLEVYKAEQWHLRDPFVTAAKGANDYVTDTDVFASSQPNPRLVELLATYGIFNRTLFPIRRNGTVFGAVTFTRRTRFDEQELDFLKRIAGLVYTDITRTVMNTFARQSLKLSDGEFVCLRFASQGMTSEEVSRMTNYTTETVNTYMKTASRKLNARSRAHAIAEALRRNIID